MPGPVVPQRIHVLVFGSLGDVLPLAALGAELARRGHDVTVWSGRRHVRRVERLGVRVRVLDTDGLPPLKSHVLPIFQPPALWRRVERRMQAGYLALAEEVAALPPGSPRPLLVASSFALAGRLAQEALGLRLATVHLAPACMASLMDPPQFIGLPLPDWARSAMRSLLERWAFDPTIRPGLNEFRAQIGLPPVRRVLSQWLHSPDLVLGLFPAWFAPPEPGWPAAVQLLDFPLEDGGLGMDLAQEDPVLDAFLRAGAPPVVCYPGSIKRDEQAFFSEALRAGARTGQRLVLLTRDPQEHLPGGVAALPDWALHRPYAPFAQLLPRSRALVHCGGVGTMAQALRSGCPQLLLPFTFDQFDNAHRMHQHGLGHVDRSARWGASLGQLLGDEGLLARCRQRQACLPTHGGQVLTQAAQAVETLAQMG